MISGDRWMFMWRSAPESSSVTQLVSQSPGGNRMTEPPSTDQQADAGPLLGSAAPSLEALRDAVVHAAGELAPAAADSDGAPLSSGGRGGVTLERPPPPHLGRFSTHSALLPA